MGALILSHDVCAPSFATGLKDEGSIEFKAYPILKEMAACTKGDKSKYQVHTSCHLSISKLDTSAALGHFVFPQHASVKQY
jgi:hypothetical protein